MKQLTGYYIPRTASDARAFDTQFKRKTPLTDPPAEGPIHFPVSGEGFAYDAWQEIVKSLRPYPCTLTIFSKDKRVVDSRRIDSRNHLETCFVWYWDKSEHMTLGYRFAPEQPGEPANIGIVEYMQGKQSKKRGDISAVGNSAQR